jgi:hypothetical protein
MVYVGKCFFGVAPALLPKDCNEFRAEAQRNAEAAENSLYPFALSLAELRATGGQCTKSRRHEGILQTPFVLSLSKYCFVFPRSKTGHPLMFRIACGSDRLRVNGDGGNFSPFMPSHRSASPKPPTSPHSQSQRL